MSKNFKLYLLIIPFLGCLNPKLMAHFNQNVSIRNDILNGYRDIKLFVEDSSKQNFLDRQKTCHQSWSIGISSYNMFSCTRRCFTINNPLPKISTNIKFIGTKHIIYGLFVESSIGFDPVFITDFVSNQLLYAIGMSFNTPNLVFQDSEKKNKGLNFSIAYTHTWRKNPSDGDGSYKNELRTSTSSFLFGIQYASSQRKSYFLKVGNFNGTRSYISSSSLHNSSFSGFNIEFGLLFNYYKLKNK